MKKTILTTAAILSAIASAAAQQPYGTTSTNGLPTTKKAPISANGKFAKEDANIPTDGYWVKETPVNQVLQYLARKAKLQYIYNDKIQDLKITGHIYEGNPLAQMRELTYLHKITIYKKGKTLYAMTQDDLDNLPLSQSTYNIKYLRVADIDAIKAILQPVLSARGSVQLEPKTGTLVLRDAETNMQAIKELLNKVDVAQKQIIVETKVLRTRGGTNNFSGLDWTSLGETGISATGLVDIASVFGVQAPAAGLLQKVAFGGTPTAAGSNVLNPLQAGVVLRALNTGNIADQVSSPTLITEDNEKATLRIIDRIPIITSTNTQGLSSTVSGTEVRYKIDESDSTDPESSREVGISVVITPKILPDDTIRMALKPRIASIVGFQTAPDGNRYPQVQEAETELITRIPNGHTLIVGGFYSTNEIQTDNKVPILGDIPLVKFLFKSKSRQKERSALAFLITPKTYDPSSVASTVANTNRIKNKMIRENGKDYPDKTRPHNNHLSNTENLKIKNWKEKKYETNHELSPYNKTQNKINAPLTRAQRKQIAKAKKAKKKQLKRERKAYKKKLKAEKKAYRKKNASH